MELIRIIGQPPLQYTVITIANEFLKKKAFPMVGNFRGTHKEKMLRITFLVSIVDVLYVLETFKRFYNFFPRNRYKMPDLPLVDLAHTERRR